jgi:D-aspartate ligase
MKGVIIVGNHVQALGLARSLGRKKIPVYLINDKSLCISKFSKYVKKFFLSPSIKDEPGLFKFLTDLAKKEKVDKWILIPTNDAAVYALSKNKKALEEYYTVPTPDWEITKYAYDKKLTYALAKENSIPMPETFYPKDLEDLKNNASKIKFPVIIKPSVMYRFYEKTKLKAIKAENMDELVEAYNSALKVIDPSEIMVQDIIPGRPGDLYSYCSLYKDKKVIAGMVGKRIRQRPMDFGKGTTFAASVDVPQIAEYGERLLKAMDYYGLSEVEFKMDPRDNEYKLLEINSRTWLWHSLAIRCGLNFPYMFYQDIIGEEITPAPKPRIGVKWLHFYTDFSVVLGEILKGRMKISDYLKSLKGEKEYAVFTWDDPVPFIAETLMLPYLKIVR